MPLCHNHAISRHTQDNNSILLIMPAWQLTSKPHPSIFINHHHDLPGLPPLQRVAVLDADATETLLKAGDLLSAIDEGAWTKEQFVATLEQMCRGEHPGRSSATEITLFNSVGSALEDLAAASLAYDAWAAAQHR